MQRILLCSLVIAGLLLFYFNDPESSFIFATCPFYLLVGLYCPGCGSQRSIHDLLHLKLYESIDHNILVLLFLPLLIGYFIAFLTKSRALDQMLLKPQIPIVVLIIVVGFWIGRNLGYEWSIYLQPGIYLA